MDLPSPVLLTSIATVRTGWRIMKLPPFEAVLPMLHQVHAFAESSPGWRVDGAPEQLISHKLTALSSGVRNTERFAFSAISDMAVLALAQAVSLAIDLDPERPGTRSDRRYELVCWLQTTLAKIAERCASDAPAVTIWSAKVNEILGDSVVVV